jgi:hypothetical protein
MLEAVFTMPSQKVGVRSVSRSLWCNGFAGLVDEASNTVWIIDLSRNENVQVVA